MNLRVITQKYTCDECTVCCTVMAAQELGKPFYAKCEHLVERGCGIYEQRPQCCRDFVCSWAAGLMGSNNSWRPDRSGLLFFVRRFPDGLWLEIYEAEAGAAEDLSRIDYLSRKILDFVTRTERVIGTRLHRVNDKIALGFEADARKYPGSEVVSRKMSRYSWIEGDPSRQVFLESHDP
jgi:hypothetical protein